VWVNVRVCVCVCVCVCQNAIYVHTQVSLHTYVLACMYGFQDVLLTKGMYVWFSRCFAYTKGM
jgi:hypothetical protein